MRSEPVLTASTVSGAIIALLAAFHVVLDLGTVEAIVAAVLPLVLSLFARAKVTPTA
jgi:hypothetical protein